MQSTESENKEELDRFCEVLIQIRKEIDEIEQGIVSLAEWVTRCQKPLRTIYM